ncbi:X-ray radiation resistance-associated protein 1 [Polypterus senegalus]|nr:X-ray radiation resistance-associated protein 1 [Polypterus senegalus]XP_039601562.1 X-ray radiation resistance-associated protein 1 [Polypterus senegalus]
METTQVCKLDDGEILPTYCFPVRPLFQQKTEGAGHWLVAQRSTQLQKYKAALSVKGGTYYGIEERPQVKFHQRCVTPVEVNVLNGNFLMKLHCVEDPSDLCSVNISDKNLSVTEEEEFGVFNNIAYINAIGNNLNLAPFRKFPNLRELELCANNIQNCIVNIGDFTHLEVLDLSYNYLSSDAVLALGLLPSLQVLHLSGNGLHTLPPDMASPCKISSDSVTGSIPRFQSLRILMLDDNKLSHPEIFTSLANLKCLTHLNLDNNGLTEVPYLQQMENPEYLFSLDINQKIDSEQHQFFRNSYKEKDFLKDHVRAVKQGSEGNAHTSGQTSHQCSDIGIKDCSILSEVSTFDLVPNYYSKKKLHLELQPPLPELRHLSLAYNKIAEESALLPVALFPSLKELVIHGNPLTTQRSGDLTLLTSFLQNRLDIKVHRKKTAKTEKPHFTLPLNPKRKVTTKIPKIPKQLPILDDCYSDSLLLKLGFAQLRPAISDSIKDLAENKPLPPIGTLPQTDRKEADSEEQIHNVQVTEEQDTEAFFMTQVDDLPESEWLLNSESNEKTMSKTETKEENAVPEKYKGFEELMDARPDSTMLEPVGIQQNVRALQYALKHLLVYRDNKARLDTVQRPFMSKEKTVKPQLPEPRKSKGEKVEECLTKIKESTAITEVPLVSLLQDRKARRRKHAEALDLLKELQQNYTKVHDNALQQAAEIEKHTQDILSKVGKKQDNSTESDNTNK